MYLVHITWLVLSVGTTRYPGHFSDKETVGVYVGTILQGKPGRFIEYTANVQVSFVREYMPHRRNV